MTVPSAAVFVRPTEPGDVDAVMAIQEACGNTVSVWPAQAYQGAEGYESLVAVREGRVVGFLLFRAAAEEAEILNVAVSPLLRREGIGAALLRAAFDAAAGRGAQQAFLEVRESNSAAAAFYRRMGFAECGRRPRYYSSPLEDALVFSRTVGANK